jgi:hypothetical protein
LQNQAQDIFSWQVMNWSFAFRRKLVAKPDFFWTGDFHPQIPAALAMVCPGWVSVPDGGGGTART